VQPFYIYATRVMGIPKWPSEHDAIVQRERADAQAARRGQ
jgi:hypothetical protein